MCLERGKHQPLHKEGRDAGCVQEAGMRRIPERAAMRGVHSEADRTPIQGGEETERVREAMIDELLVFAVVCAYTWVSAFIFWWKVV